MPIRYPILTFFHLITAMLGGTPVFPYQYLARNAIEASWQRIFGVVETHEASWQRKDHQTEDGRKKETEHGATCWAKIYGTECHRGRDICIVIAPCGLLTVYSVHRYCISFNYSQCSAAAISSFPWCTILSAMFMPWYSHLLRGRLRSSRAASILVLIAGVHYNVNVYRIKLPFITSVHYYQSLLPVSVTLHTSSRQMSNISSDPWNR